MATRLKHLQIDRVDLVDKGANPGAHIVLFKRDPLIEKEATMSPEDIAVLQKRVADAEEAMALAKAEAEKGVALEKRLADAEAKAAAAEEVAKRERGERLKRDYLAKAESYKGLPVKPEEDYRIFEALDSLDETFKAAGARIVDLLAAADEAMIQAGLFKSQGQGGSSDSGSAWNQIDALAKRHVAEGKAPTHAQAVVKVLDDNPELARSYYADRA